MSKMAVLWLLLAVFCGTVLFHTSQSVQEGQGKIAALKQKTVTEEEALKILRAEWSYLNQPARLEKLAAGHLDLVPLKGSQFATLQDIPDRAGEALSAESRAEAAVSEQEDIPVVRGDAEKKNFRRFVRILKTPLAVLPFAKTPQDSLPPAVAKSAEAE